MYRSLSMDQDASPIDALRSLFGDAVLAPIKSLTDSIKSIDHSRQEENFDDDRSEEIKPRQRSLPKCACANVDAAIIDDENFRRLQRSLRKRGCVTNTFLQQNVHHYIRNVKCKK